jgi:hypothetical protein
MEVARSMKKMILIETCRNVLFIGGRRTALIQKKKNGLACMVQRFNNNARERT